MTNKMPLSPNDFISKNIHIAQRLFDERMLVITAKDSMLHRFNEAGTFIWSTLDKPTSLKEICKSLEEHFKGFDARNNFNEISDFITALKEKNLVHIEPVL
jgi:hypothetical protein